MDAGVHKCTNSSNGASASAEVEVQWWELVRPTGTLGDDTLKGRLVVHTAVDGSSGVLCLQPDRHSEKAAVRAVACDSTDVAGQGGDEQGWEYDDLKHALRHSRL